MCFTTPNLTHSLFFWCGLILFSYLPAPLLDCSLSGSKFIFLSYHELLPFVLENPFLSLGHHVLLSLSFVAPSSTTGNSCWWQMSHNQLKACSWLQPWGKLQNFFIFALCSSTFIQMQQSHLFLKYSFLREFPAPLHHQDWIPVKMVGKNLHTVLFNGVSKYGWHLAPGVLFWAVRACQCIISLPNMHRQSSRLECADKLSSYQPWAIYILAHHVVQYFHLFPGLLWHSTSILSSPTHFFYLPLASQKEHVIVQWGAKWRESRVCQLRSQIAGQSANSKFTRYSNAMYTKTGLVPIHQIPTNTMVF